jgi:hypothetical protein
MHHRTIDRSPRADRFEDANARDPSSHAIIITRFEHHRFARKFFAHVMLCDTPRDRSMHRVPKNSRLIIDDAKHATIRCARLSMCVVRSCANPHELRASHASTFVCIADQSRCALCFIGDAAHEISPTRIALYVVR